jgi:4,5-DOPA dioxygenase extradiol
MTTPQPAAFFKKMPVLFTGHGSPMNAIEENRFTEGFRKIAGTLPEPRSILCISAHWYTNGTKITSAEAPATIHDFYGFPAQLYDVQYPAIGNPKLAYEIKELLKPVIVGLDDTRGLDHGAWSVLRHFYPEANVPVVQLSIDYTQPASYHFNLAKKLAPLRDKAVLIVASGNIVHNLELVDFQNIDKPDYGYDWAIEAKEIINQNLLGGNYEALADYRKLPRSVQTAIPTPDHYLPLMYVLGLQEKGENITLFNDELVAGSLSMTSLIIK